MRKLSSYLNKECKVHVIIKYNQFNNIDTRNKEPDNSIQMINNA